MVLLKSGTSVKSRSKYFILYRVSQKKYRVSQKKSNLFGGLLDKKYAADIQNRSRFLSVKS